MGIVSRYIRAKHGTTVPFIVLVSALITSCAGMPSNSAGQVKPSLSDFHLYPIEGLDVVFDRIDPDNNLSDGQNVRKGQVIGRISPMPNPESKAFQADLDRSRQLYAENDYPDAVQVLTAALQSDPNNPFILEARARAYYHFDRDASYSDYRTLITYLDSAQPGSVVIDLWFPEAYFKIATLELDRREYKQAAIDLARTLSAMQSRGEFDYQLAHNSPLIEQIFQYLAESYHEQGDASKSRYYATLTLQVDPANIYALCVMSNKSVC